jgi:tetratricopeptide (TPR) repeat protein
VIGVGVSGSGNIIAKDVKGYNFNFYAPISSEQLKTIMAFSTTLDAQSYKQVDSTTELHNLTKTKQQTAQVIEQINKVEKDEGREIQEIKVGDVQISKNELLIKEHILKGNEFYYKKEYDRAIECYDKALGIDPMHARAWNNKGIVLGILGNYNEAIGLFI